jgi:putative membrane protein
MKTFSTLAEAALLVAAATLANAQTQSQVHPVSCSQKREAVKDALTPTAFAATAAQDGMTEVALGGLALRNSHNDQVKQFALGMLADHAQVNQELQAIVKRKGLILPTSLDTKYQAILTSLNAKSGPEFDKAYLEIIANDHAQAVALFESASRSSDPDVAAFARKNLSTLQEHNELANKLRADIGIRAVRLDRIGETLRQVCEG